VFAEQPLELTQARHLGATKTEPARYLSEVASAVGRVFYGRDATCWQPYVKGLTIAANSIFNGWGMEDVWLDNLPLPANAGQQRCDRTSILPLFLLSGR